LKDGSAKEQIAMPQPLRSGRLLALTCSLAALSLVVSAQTQGSPERYSASAINANNGSAGNIDITVTRWSTEQERESLIKVMKKDGPEKLLDALQDMRSVGHFGAPGNLSWDLRFARKTPLPEGGERVILVTDRPIGFWEATNQPRSITYPFTVIELRLDRDGNGEGKMSLATKIIYDEDTNMITLENYNLQPVQLGNVKREKVSH